MSFASIMAAQVDPAVRSILGQPVLYAPSEGAAVTVNGVFDAAYNLVEAGIAGVSSNGPAVFLSLSDLPSDPSEDAALITVASVVYSVREAKPDGLGGTLVVLHETA